MLIMMSMSMSEMLEMMMLILMLIPMMRLDERGTDAATDADDEVVVANIRVVVLPVDKE